MWPVGQHLSETCWSTSLCTPLGLHKVITNAFINAVIEQPFPEHLLCAVPPNRDANETGSFRSRAHKQLQKLMPYAVLLSEMHEPSMMGIWGEIQGEGGVMQRELPCAGVPRLQRRVLCKAEMAQGLEDSGRKIIWALFCRSLYDLPKSLDFIS